MRWGLIALSLAAILVTACGSSGSAPAHSKAWRMGYTYGQRYHTNYLTTGQSQASWCHNMALQANWSDTWARGCTAGLHGN